MMLGTAKRALTVLAAVWASSAGATDTWVNVAPGIDRLQRVLTSPTHQVIHAVKVDLGNSNYYARSNRINERGHTTTGFSQLIGPEAVVVINGDWGTASAPWNVQGLAIGGGDRWNPDKAFWSFIACTLDDNHCEMDFSGPAASATLNPRWWAAVGSNSWVLVQHGVPTPGTGFDSARNPRSALGLSQDGKTLWMVVIEGRRSSATGVATPYADGMLFGEVVALMVDLGCYDAVMQDGGGSSALVVNGARVSRLPANQSVERTVANHFAIVRAGGTDPECATLKKGRYCTGTQVHTCEGGHHSVGDCGAFGLGCEQQGTWAYCKDPRCPSVSGGSCSGTKITNCVDGVYSEGDCAGYGLGCGMVAGKAVCIDAKCGGDPGFSACAGNTLKRCAAGVYAETTCTTPGLPCVTTATGASCGDPRCAGLTDGGACQDYFLNTCVNGVFNSVDCSDQGAECVDGPGPAACVPVPPVTPDGGVDAGVRLGIDGGSGGAGGGSGGGVDVNSNAGLDQEPGPLSEARGGFGCNSAGGSLAAWAGVAWAVSRRWRRRQARRESDDQ
jgi:hypothetical protein